VEKELERGGIEGDTHILEPDRIFLRPFLCAAHRRFAGTRDCMRGRTGKGKEIMETNVGRLIPSPALIA